MGLELKNLLPMPCMYLGQQAYPSGPACLFQSYEHLVLNSGGANLQPHSWAATKLLIHLTCLTQKCLAGDSVSKVLLKT